MHDINWNGWSDRFYPSECVTVGGESPAPPKRDPVIPNDLWKKRPQRETSKGKRCQVKVETCQRGFELKSHHKVISLFFCQSFQLFTAAGNEGPGSTMASCGRWANAQPPARRNKTASFHSACKWLGEYSIRDQPSARGRGGGRGSVGRSGDWGCHRFQQRSNLSRQASDAVYSSPANRLIRPIHSARRNRSKSPALKSDWNRCPRQPLSITSWFPPPTIAADDATFILRRRIKRFSFLGSRRRFGRSSNATVPTDGWPPVSTRAKMRRFAKVLQYGYARRY